MNSIIKSENKGANFSKDGKYRYALWRIWDDRNLDILGPRYAMCIGLNPSTANGETDDATIRRLRGLIKELDYAGFYMCNLFGYITPYPEVLEAVGYENAIGENDKYLFEIRGHCADVIFCWGNFNVHTRADKVKEYFPDGLCFGKNKNGSPKHPLYLKSGTKLTAFKSQET